MAERFHGNLNETMSLEEIFYNIAEYQRRGWLVLTLDDRMACLFFQGDLLALVSEPTEKFQLIPEKLYFAAQIPEEVLQEFKEGEPLDYLANYVSFEQLESMKNTICYEEICSLFNWHQGTFEFFDQSDPEANENWIPISQIFEMEGILREVATRRKELEEQRDISPNMDEILVQEQPLDMQYDPTDPSWNIWIIAQHRSVRDTLLYSLYGEFDAWRILNSLMLSGNLRLISEEEAKEIAQNFIQKNQYETASEYLNLLLRRNPMNLDACEILAECYRKLGYTEEMAYLYKAVGEHLLGHEDRSHHVQGAKYLQKFCNLMPDSIESVSIQSYLFHMVFQEELDARALQYNLVVEGKKLYQILHARKEDIKGREILEYILELAPLDKSLQSQYINVCLDLKDTKAAIAQYKKVAELYEQEQNWEEVLSIYEKIEKLSPNDKSVKKKIKVIQNKQKQKQRSSYFTFQLIFLLAIVGVTVWYYPTIMKMVYEKTDVIVIQYPEEWLAILNRRQQQIDRHAKLAIPEIEALIKSKEWNKAESLVKKHLATKPTAKLFSELQEQKKIVDQNFSDIEANRKSFLATFETAKNLEKMDMWDQALNRYIELWTETKYLKLEERNNIQIPILMEVKPLGTEIWVDDKKVKVVDKESFVLHCRPNFKTITVSLPGYSSKSFTNDLPSIGKPRIYRNKQSEWSLLKGEKIIVSLGKEPIWTLPLKSNREVINGTPIVLNNETLLCVSRDDKIYSFSNFQEKQAPTIDYIWTSPQIQFSNFVADPCYYNGVLYIGAQNGKFFAWDVKERKLIGLFGLPKPEPIDKRPCIVPNQELVVFSTEKIMYALPLLSSFTNLWKTKWMPFKSPKKLDMEPVAAGDNILVGSADGFLYCFNGVTGKIRWRYRVGSHFRCRAIVLDDIAYFSGNGYFHAVDVKTGININKKRIVGDVVSSPLFYKNMFYCSTNRKTIMVLDTNFNVKWTRALEALTEVTPMISPNNILYVGSKKTQDLNTAILYAMNADNGAILWKYNIPESMNASPVIVNNMVVQVADKVYGFIDN